MNYGNDQTRNQYYPNTLNDLKLPVALNPFVLTGGTFKPGEADKFYEDILDERRKNICKAELLYYRGFPQEVCDINAQILKTDDISSKLAGCLITAITSLFAGDVDKIMETYRFLKSIRSETDRYPRLKTTINMLSLYFHIILYNKDDIVLPDVGVDAFAVKNELKPISVYIYSHYLILNGNFGKAVGLSECALVFTHGTCPVSEIYLSLITCIGYLSLHDWERAEYFFLYAWKNARPDGLIMPFVELRGLLSGMVEKHLKVSFPEEYRRINELSAIYHKNWVRVHNAVTGEKVSDQLTGSEFNVAMLATKGLSNEEIGKFLGISVNSVRAHLRNIFNKLGIDSRKDLCKFVIK